MKILLLLISILSFGFINDAAAASIPNCDATQYECYVAKVRIGCINKNESLPWTKPPYDTSWVLRPNCAINNIQYAPFTKVGVDGMVSCMQNDEQANQRALQDGISLESIGNFSGFRGLEVARTLYRKRMNSVFACGIIASRFAKLDALEEAINRRDTTATSEIKNRIRTERDRYSRIKVELQCDLTSQSNVNDTLNRMAGTAMKEYCQYTYYLDYLEANTRENITNALSIDRTIGSVSGASLPQTTDDLARVLSDRSIAVRGEREKANKALPLAIRTFREMDRTYIIHILLTLIYDDYITLRSQLDKYLVITGQTFEKAFNAQDAR